MVCSPGQQLAASCQMYCHRANRAWGRWRGVPVGRYGAAYGACVDGWGWNFVGMW